MTRCEDRSEVRYTRDDVVEVALSMVGVLYHHQGRSTTAGVDCIGLMVTGSRTLGDEPHDFTAYGMQPKPDDLLAHARQGMIEIPVEDADNGDVLAFWYAKRDVVHHFGWIVPGGMVHALAEKNRVELTPIDHFWRRRIMYAFRLKGLVV